MIVIIIRQVLIMFLLLGIGIILFKTGKLTNEGSKTLGNILIYLVLPCVIISGFMVERTPERVKSLLVSIALALGVLLIAMLISRILCGRSALDNFAGSFSNPGFFGVPIIVALMGDGAVFYMAAYIAFLNLLQWTYGVSLLKNSDASGMLKKRNGEQERSLKERAKELLNMLMKAPFMVAIIIGLLLFFTQLPVPSVVSSCIRFIKDINTPLSMFTIGVYTAQVNVREMVVKKRLYLVSAVRLLIIPVVVLLLLKVLPIYSEELKICMLIAAACPVGANVAVYAQLYDRDYRYAVETVVISTLLSILTIPAVVAIFNAL